MLLPGGSDGAAALSGVLDAYLVAKDREASSGTTATGRSRHGVNSRRILQNNIALIHAESGVAGLLCQYGNSHLRVSIKNTVRVGVDNVIGVEVISALESRPQCRINQVREIRRSDTGVAGVGPQKAKRLGIADAVGGGIGNIGCSSG